MAVGFKVNGVDIDTLFKTRSTSKRADVGYQKQSVDVSNNFEKTAGGDLIAFNTGYQSAGADLKTMLQDITFGGTLYATSSNYSPAGGNIGNGPFNSAGIVITAGGGTGGYTYAWARQSGDATIGIGSATSSTPTWSASGTAPSSKSAVWRCTVTDSAAHTATVDVTVTISFYSALSANLDKASVSGSGTGNGPYTTDTVTGTPAGGAGGYTYLWEYVSGDSVTVVNSTSVATAFSGSATAPSELVGLYRLKVTDSLGNAAYSSNVTVTLTFNSSTVDVTTDKSSVYGERGGAGTGTATTDIVTATPTGGTPDYTYLWERTSGDASTSCVGSTSAAAYFTRVSAPTHLYASTWRCRVTDSLGNIAYSDDVTVQLLFDN